GQGVGAVGRIGEVRGAVVDGLDGVGAARGAGRQVVAGGRGPVGDVDGDGTADDRGAAEDREGLGALVDGASRAADGGAEVHRLASGAERDRDVGGGGRGGRGGDGQQL